MGHPSDPKRRFTVYGYAAGAELADGSAAPGRRVALGYDDESAQDLSTEGLRLLDSAVAWALATTFAHDANGNLTGSSDGLKLGYNTAGHHRYYQPELGRWTQPDPLQGRINPAMPGETNPYAYAGCNPVNYTDPTGLVSQKSIASVATGPRLNSIAWRWEL